VLPFGQYTVGGRAFLLTRSDGPGMTVVRTHRRDGSMPGQNDNGSRRAGRFGKARGMLTAVVACAFLADGPPLAALVMTR
jgi:hypothetical protein